MARHDVTLVFENGRSVTVAADENETIYIAALKNKVRLETDCREGACATCKGLCTQGEYWLDDYSDEALSDEEASRREVLTCQMHATSDCVIEMPYDSDIALKTGPATRPGKVVEVARVSSTVVRLVLDAPGEAAIAFLPGQYVHLSVPGTDQHRSYSFANAPGDAERLVFYIKVLEEGAMSEYVAGRAAAGDSMEVTGPFGRFYLRPPERPVVMVAGGTGLAPMLAMLDHMVATGATAQPIHLLYGVNDADEFFALDQLDGYSAEGLNLTVERCVLNGAAGWNGPTGHVTGLLRSDLLNGGDVDVYLCGPPPMIEAGTSWLLANGVEDRRIHVEKFLPS